MIYISNHEEASPSAEKMDTNPSSKCSSWYLVWLLLLFVAIRYFDTTKEFSSFTHIKKHWITELKFGLFSKKLYECKFFLKMLPIYWKILITRYINHTYIFIALLVYSLLV